MHQTLRPYATAGIAIVGTSLIGIAPVAAPSPDIQVRDIAFTAGDSSPLGDFLAPWIDQYNTASENVTQLTNNYFLAPGVGLQQAIANQSDFWQQILDDPSKIPDVAQQMQDNLDAVLTGFTLQNATDDTLETITYHTLSGTDQDVVPAVIGHDALLLLLPLFLSDEQKETLEPIIDFLASPASGIIMGSLGPAISPWIALFNSISDGDGLNEILANVVGAYFNGATLNLDDLIPLIADSDLLPLPEGVDIDHLDFAFGGLLTAGDVAPDYALYDASGDVTNEVPAVGGSILNSLGITIDASGLGLPIPPLDIASHAVGPVGAWLGWGQAVGGVLGMDWWDGKNAPVVPPADPPLSGVDYPIIPTDTFDDGGASDAAGATAADIANVLNELGISLTG